MHNKLQNIKFEYWIIAVYSILFLTIRLLFKFDGLYGQDAYEYLRYTENLYAYILHHAHLTHFFWGLGYPFLGFLFKLIVQDTALALHLVAMLSGIITLIFVRKIVQLIYPDIKNDVLHFIILAFSPAFFIQSMLIMSDMLATCCIVLSVYFSIRFHQFSKNRHLYLAILFSMLSLHVRYASLILLFPFLLMVAVQLIQTKKYIQMLVSIVMVGLLALPQFLIRAESGVEFLSHGLISNWHVINFFKNNFNTADGESNYLFFNILYVLYPLFHPAFIFFGSILMFIIIKHKINILRINTYQKILLASVIPYAIFLGGIPFQNRRFLIVSFPLLYLFFFPILNETIKKQYLKKWIILALITIQLMIISFIGKAYYERNKLEQTIASHLHQLAPNTLYVFDIDPALKGRKVNMHFQNLWYKQYDDFENNALVLINKDQIEKQWKGKNPYINQQKIFSTKNLKVLKVYNDSWTLYQINTIEKK